MNKTMRLTKGAVAVAIIAGFILSTPLLAQESQTDPSQKAQAEMVEVFGTFPSFMKMYPKHALAGVWEWMKAMDGPEGVIPPKYAELIGLAVASQIPCTYCVHVHTASARMFGASDVEIQEAVARAAYTRHWSTVVNSANIDLEDFKAEWDKILAYMKEKSETKKTTKK